MISKSFLKSSIVITFSNALPMAGSIILLPFYTNRLNHELFLQLVYYIAITALVQVFFSFSAETFFGVKYTRLAAEPERQRSFTGTLSVLLLSLGAFLLLLFSLAGPWLFRVIFKTDIGMSFWPYGFFSVITGFFNAYFKVATNALIYFRKERLYFFVNLVNFLATVGISISGLVLFPDTLIGPMYGRLLSGAIIFGLALYIFISSGGMSFDTGFIREIVVFCTPYLVFVACIWLLTHVDRFFMQARLSNDEINAYDTALKCFFGILFVQNGLSAVIFPRVFSIWSGQEKLKTTTESNRYFNVYNVVNIVLLILFCIFIPLLYQVFIKKAGFYQATQYIGLLAAGYAFSGILNYYLATIQYAKKMRVLLEVYVLSAVFQVVTTYFAIRTFGLIGAIYAGILTKAIQVLLSMLFTRGVFAYEYNFYKLVGVPLAYVFLNIIQYYVFPGYSATLYILQLAVFGALFYFIYRNEVRTVLKQYLAS